MSPLPKRSFASDNNAGIHPEILDAIHDANQGHVIGYGDDSYTQEAMSLLKHHFGENIKSFLVYNGTGANVLALKSLVQSYQAIICADCAHINTHETGAPEYFIGAKLMTIPTTDGKINCDQIKALLTDVGNPHAVQPKVIALSQPTEMGTVYSIEELRAITAFAHQHDLLVYVDGARLANAVASLDVSLKAMTTDINIDVFSFGGTKNGILAGEAIIFSSEKLAENFQYLHKQGLQLASKMRFLAAQYIGLFNQQLWLRNASHANKMASLLAMRVATIPEIELTMPVESNTVFARLPVQIIKNLQEIHFFYVWDGDVVRWVTSFDTTESDIEEFVLQIKVLLKTNDVVS